MFNITEKQKNEKEYYIKKYKHYFEISNPNNEINIEDRNIIVRVDISNIHKFGVFANRDINKNEIITKYPAHYICKSNEYSIYNINHKLPNNFKDYMFDLDIKNNIIILGNPMIFGNMSWVGHKINDGYKHNCIINSKKNRNKYNKQTKKFNNAVFGTCMISSIVSIIATKNIKKDEEILVSYGFNYWLDQNLNT